MGKGTNTTTTQSGPPAQYLQQYQQINQQAQNVASQPYQPYTGNLVAGLSPDQQSAIGSIQGLQGVANPYIDAAAQEIGQSTTPLQPSIQGYVNNATTYDQDAAQTNLAAIAAPGITSSQNLYNQSANQLTPQQFSGSAVQQYESPYTQSVVNATQAQFNNQNAQQQQQVRGNAASQGAFGGDREAVAEGITAGQQQLAQAPVIAGLENQGYSQALNEFNNQQGVNLGAQQASQQLQQGAAAGILAGSAQNLSAYQQQAQNNLAAAQGITGISGQVLGANEANNYLASQAGFGLGNLGNEALNTGLTGAQAQLSAGGLEQQQAQQELNVPYEQYIAQQAYPFQTTGFEANIAEGLGGASGGTSSTTSPGPSAGSQVAGAALLGTGILGQTGAFGSASNGYSGYLTGAGDGSGIIDSAGFDVARGGAIPHRASGGPLSSFGLPNSPINGAVQIPTGVPDVSASVIPGAEGLGTKSSGRGSFNLNTSTGSTTTTTGGGDPLLGLAGSIIGGPVLGGGIAGSLLGSQIGSRLASGGIVSAFPHIGKPMAPTHSFIPHIPHLAAGGITGGNGIVVPQLSGGAGSIAGGNGVSIPQLGGGGHGGITSSGGIGAVNDYLAANKAPPPAPVSAPAPAPAAAAPAAVPAADAPPVSQTGGFSNLNLTVPEQIQLQAQLDAENNEGNAQQALNGSPGGNRGGSIRNIQHRDDGGGIIDDPLPQGIRSSLLNEAYVPPDDSGYYGPPEGRTPTGPGPSPQLGTPLTDATPRPYTGPPPPPQPDQSGSGAAPQPGNPVRQSASAPGGSGSPWQTLLNVGLGILSGTSPHAGVNIGRGALEGLQISQQQRASDERNNLARLAQDETSRYHTGELGARQQEVTQQGQTAQARLAQEAANQALLRQHQDAELAQQLKLGLAHIGLEGANVAESKRFHLDESANRQQSLAEEKRYHDLLHGTSNAFPSPTDSPAKTDQPAAIKPLNSSLGFE